jgi:hypothetical protein
MPEVSVIIPCYNHALYLPFAIESVLAQSFTEWEAILVDDGSTDDTRAVAAGFTDPRIRYVYQENRGLPTARNTGIHAAQGRYLAFLDADDEWEPTFLWVCQDALAAMDTSVAVVTLTRYIDEDGAVLPRSGGAVLQSDQFRDRLLEGGFFPVHAVLVRADAVRQVGLFDETLTSLEDWDLWLRITSSGGLMACIPQPLARYRQTPGSMSSNVCRMHANRMAVLAKHFGAPAADPATWAHEKRQAYACAYRSASLAHLQQHDPDAAWRWLGEAARTWPPILARLDTFYELALGDQPRGYRGDARGVDPAASGADMLLRLEALFTNAPAGIQAMRHAALGNAYLALGMLTDQAGSRRAACGYLIRAVNADPHLLRSTAVARRLLKLCVGQLVLRPR